MGESDIYGDPSLLFFFQPIGINSGQSLNECTLPVVDVSGGANDDRSHRRSKLRGPSNTLITVNQCR